ncbi:MAG: polysaccharide deacetylase family protein [Dethiobacteria bacterium]
MLFALTVSSCSSPPEENPPAVDQSAAAQTAVPDHEEFETDDVMRPDEVRDLPPNELGRIMILMYHEIGYPESEWCRTPENFRQDLENLYREGYRLISMNDLIDGHIDVPAGTTPVVLTFDDATPGQFRYIEQEGKTVIVPFCAVAILEDFHQEHPDFGLAATFYIFYDRPFRQAEYIEQKLNYLVKKGFEIGNHTYTHSNLAALSPAKVAEQLAMHGQRTRDYLHDYHIRTLALPYGARPSDPELAIRGCSEGINYRHEAVLLVGSNPAPSPFSKDFGVYLPRIRAGEINSDGVGMYDWIDYFRNNPERRFLSDGDPDAITISAQSAEDLRGQIPGAYKKIIKK